MVSLKTLIFFIIIITTLAIEHGSGIVLENSVNDTRNTVDINTIKADQQPQKNSNSDETNIIQKLRSNIQAYNGEEATTKYPKIVATPRNDNQTIVSNIFLFVTDVANILKDNFFTNSIGLSKQEEISNTTQTTPTDTTTSAEAVTIKGIIPAELISETTATAMNNYMSEISIIDSTSTEKNVSATTFSTTTDSIDIPKEKVVITSNQQPSNNIVPSATRALPNTSSVVFPEAVSTVPVNDSKASVEPASSETNTMRSAQESDKLKQNGTATPNTNYVSKESLQQSTVTPRTDSPTESMKPDLYSVKPSTADSFTTQKERSLTTFNEHPTHDFVSSAEATTSFVAPADVSASTANAMENPIISNSSEINTILTSMQNTHTLRTQYNEIPTTESIAYLIHQTRSVEAKNNKKIITKSTSVPSFTRPEVKIHEKNKVFYKAVGGFIIGCAFLVLILYPLVYNGIKSK